MSRELEIIGLGAAVEEAAGPRPERAGDGPKHAALHTECLNCGAQLHGRFCHACGQTADDHHRSIFHLMWEAVEGLTHLDGRLARTLPPLFFKPGSLARDHFEGRRQRHVPPFRLFLVTLLLFMLALEGMLHGGGHKAGADHGPAPAAPRLGQTIVTREPDGSTRTVTVPTAAQIAGWTGGRVTAEQIERAASIDHDNARTVDAHAGEPKPGPGGAGVSAPDVTVQIGGVKRKMSPKDAIDKFDAASPTHSATGAWFSERVRKAVDNKEYFLSVVFSWAHRLAVLLLPILAGFLTLLYVYKRRFYVYDHLVVSMQFLSFTFLLWGAVYLLPKPVRDVAGTLAFFWTPVNLFMTLRGAYGSGVIGAGVKTIVLWSATVTAFGLLIGGLLLLALQAM